MPILLGGYAFGGEKEPVHVEWVPLTGDKANRLADMAGVHMDLRWTADAWAVLMYIQKKLPAKARPSEVMGVDALHDSALVRYARCFNKGRRDAFYIPDDWLDNLPKNLREAHDIALDLRNKHIAHSANDWEINYPVAEVATHKASGASTVRSVQIRQIRVVMLREDLVRDFQAVADALAKQLYKAMAQLQLEVLAEARTVPPRELKKRAPKVPPEPGQRDIRTNRGRRR